MVASHALGAPSPLGIPSPVDTRDSPSPIQDSRSPVSDRAAKSDSYKSTIGIGRDGLRKPRSMRPGPAYRERPVEKRMGFLMAIFTGLSVIKSIGEVGWLAAEEAKADPWEAESGNCVSK
jgi:hypothetical protein